MLDLNNLQNDPGLVTELSNYVVGMTEAKAELLQQELEMMRDQLVPERQLTVLVDRIDQLETGMINLGDPEGNYPEAIKSLDAKFGFISEPDALVNMATRGAAITICDKFLQEYNEALFNDGEPLDERDVASLERLISEWGRVRSALRLYLEWADPSTTE